MYEVLTIEAMHIPVLALSALDIDKYIMHKLGVVDYLVKPIDKDRLVESIEAVSKDK